MEAQYSRGQKIAKKVQKRMKIKSQETSKTVLCKGSSRNRSVCHQCGNSAPSVLLLENRPLEPGSRYISTKLEEYKGICISSFYLVGQVMKKNPERAGKPSSNSPSTAISSMVSKPVADIQKRSNFGAKVGKTFKKPSSKKSLISPKQLSAVCDMEKNIEFCGWCFEKNIDPFGCSLASVL